MFLYYHGSNFDARFIFKKNQIHWKIFLYLGKSVKVKCDECSIGQFKNVILTNLTSNYSTCDYCQDRYYSDEITFKSSNTQCKECKAPFYIKKTKFYNNNELFKEMNNNCFTNIPEFCAHIKGFSI